VANAGGNESQISGTTNATLTLGDLGIDMRAAGIYFRINTPISFSTDQSSPSVPACSQTLLVPGPQRFSGTRAWKAFRDERIAGEDLVF
jgi:hypothetical protein